MRDGIDIIIIALTTETLNTVDDYVWEKYAEKVIASRSVVQDPEDGFNLITLFIEEGHAVEIVHVAGPTEKAEELACGIRSYFPEIDVIIIDIPFLPLGT